MKLSKFLLLATIAVPVRRGLGGRGEQAGGNWQERRYRTGRARRIGDWRAGCCVLKEKPGWRTRPGGGSFSQAPNLLVGRTTGQNALQPV